MTDGGTGARRPLRALLGNHPVGRALRRGEVSSPSLAFDWADEAVPNRAFKRVVRDLEFDVAELALMTFLMARSRGVPLRLLPVVVFSRNPLPHLVCRAEGAVRVPADLAGCRVGVRAYTTTTAVWVRRLLGDAFGVAPDAFRWVTSEEGHVAGVADPPNVHRNAGGADLLALLRTGAIDAAIVDPVPTDPAIVPVVPDPAETYAAWRARTGAECVNHVMVVRESVAGDTSVVRGLFELFRASAARVDSGTLVPPMGMSANRRNFEAAISAAAAEGLLAGPLRVEDLVTEALGALT